MNIVRLEPEFVYALIHKIRCTHLALSQSMDTINTETNNMDWIGLSQDDFLQNISYHMRKIKTFIDEINILSIGLEKEVAQWISEDSSFEYGPGMSWMANNATQFSEYVWVTNDKSVKLANVFALFSNNSDGQRLIQSAYSAGLFFVIMEGGKEVGWLGDPNGKRMPISWEEIEGVYGHYINTDGEERVELNPDYRNDSHVYLNTLAHEMQHAIDFNSSALDQEAIRKMDALLNSDSVKTMSINEVEDVFANGLTEYVKSEVNAHDMGNRIDASYNLYEDRLNAQDGIYTYEEYDYVVNKRPYETLYEDTINDWLKETYGSDTSYRADVWLDRNGIIQVDIDQSRPLIPRIIDQVNLPWGA